MEPHATPIDTLPLLDEGEGEEGYPSELPLRRRHVAVAAAVAPSVHLFALCHPMLKQQQQPPPPPLPMP